MAAWWSGLGMTNLYNPVLSFELVPEDDLSFFT
jgi:hypothetical protein